MSGSRIGRILVLAIAMAIALSLGVGSVESAIPNPTNKKFYACFSKRTGAVRLINYPKVDGCAKGWRLVTWNAKGPTGPQGPSGATGPQGVQGPQGPSGPSDWASIANKPAGFADGKDDIGFTSHVIRNQTTPLDGGEYEDTYFYSDNDNIDYEFSALPAIAPGSIVCGRGLELQVFIGRLEDGRIRYDLRVWNRSSVGEPITYKIRARAYAEGVSSAALKRALKAATVKFGKAKAAESRPR